MSNKKQNVAVLEQAEQVETLENEQPEKEEVKEVATKQAKNPSTRVNGVSIPGGFSTVTFLRRVRDDLKGIKALNTKTEETPDVVENPEFLDWVDNTMNSVIELHQTVKNNKPKTAPKPKKETVQTLSDKIAKLTPEQRDELLKSIQ